MIVDNEFALAEPDVKVKDGVEFCGRIAVAFAQSFLDERWCREVAEPEKASNLKKVAGFLGECVSGRAWARFITKAAGH